MMLLTAAWPVVAQSEGRLIGVPDNYATIEEAIAASHPVT